MMKILLCILVLGSILTCGSARQEEPVREIKWEFVNMSLENAKSMEPRDGFVPDEATAVKIGEAVAAAQYGEDVISEERPFRGRLRDNVWTVIGTLYPIGVFGGTAVIKISKTDGRVLFLTHQQ